MISVQYLTVTSAIVLKMCDNVSYGTRPEGKTKTSRGNQRRKEHVESEVPRAQCENNGVERLLFNNKEQDLETFKDFVELHDQELFPFQKLTAWEERCQAFSANAALELSEKQRLECTVKNNVKGEDESYIIQSLEPLSSPAGIMNGNLQKNETTNSVAETKLVSQSYERFKNQRRKERKSSLCTLSVLPPLVEEKYYSSPSPVMRRHTIGDFAKRDKLKVPEIVLSKEENEYRETERLNLPMIEQKSGYLQIPLSLSDPHRLAPPRFLGHFKAFRPPAQQHLEDKSTIGNFRLPQLTTRNDKKENEKPESSGR